jgi:hypothetical protein
VDDRGMSVPQKEIEEGRDEEEQVLGGAMMISSVLSSLTLSHEYFLTLL